MISSELMEKYEFTAQSMGIIFGVTLLTFTGSMIPAGRLLHRTSPRRITLFSTVAYGLGFFLSGFSGGSYVLILLGSGILVGLGTGAGYVSSMTYGVSQLKNKAIPTGLITMSFALSSIIASKCLSLLTAKGFDIDSILLLFSIIQMSLMALAIILYPCKSQEPKREDAPQETTKEPKRNNWKAVLPLWLGMFCATFGGLLVISNMKQIISSLEVGALVAIPMTIASFSIGNALGRILFGLLPIKRYTLSIAIIMVSFALSLFLLGQAQNAWTLYTLILLIGVHFGSFFVLFPMATISQFGTSGISRIYPIIFLAYGTAAAVGATLGGTLYDIFGSSQISLAITCGIELIGALFLFIYFFKPITTKK